MFAGEPSHDDHGRGDSGGYTASDCICRGKVWEGSCAEAGCGFCRPNCTCCYGMMVTNQHSEDCIEARCNFCPVHAED